MSEILYRERERECGEEDRVFRDDASWLSESFGFVRKHTPSHLRVTSNRKTLDSRVLSFARRDTTLNFMHFNTYFITINFFKTIT